MKNSNLFLNENPQSIITEACTTFVSGNENSYVGYLYLIHNPDQIELNHDGHGEVILTNNTKLQHFKIMNADPLYTNPATLGVAVSFTDEFIAYSDPKPLSVSINNYICQELDQAIVKLHTAFVEDFYVPTDKIHISIKPYSEEIKYEYHTFMVIYTAKILINGWAFL